MGSQGPGGTLRRVEAEAIGAGVKPKSKKPRPSTTWVDRIIDREVRAGRLQLTSAQRKRLTSQMYALGPDTLQRLVGADATQPLVQQLEVLAKAEGEKPGSHKKNVIDRVVGTLSKWNQNTGNLILGRDETGNALSRVEDRARAAGVQPRGESNAPNLGGPPGTRLPATVNDLTATTAQGEHFTIVHHTPGNNPGELRPETQSAIADEAEQKLLAGQDLTRQEVQALASQGRLGLNQDSTPKEVRDAQFGGTGIITGYQAIPMPTGSEGAERIRKQGTLGTPNEAGVNTHGKQPIVKTAAQLEDELSDKSPAEIKALQKKLRDAALLPQGAAISGLVDPDTIKAYDELLRETANYQTHYRDLTPDQYLDKKIAGINAAGGSKTSTNRSTQTSVSLTDPITAKGYLVGSMRSLLGRMPTSGEINSFVGSLNAAERANPQVTSTTSTSTQNAAGDNTNTNTSSTSSGGIGSGASFGDDFIMQQNMPELRASNAVQFYELALQALKSPVSI